ncbi:MAG: carboxymuconolactone decarboxylase family protein [Fidelibacterota bacterium]
MTENVKYEVPRPFRRFTERYPEVADGYQRMGEAVHAWGPLDEKSRALVKLAISVGARLEGGVHSHARKAREAGVEPDEIRHAVLLSLPTVGLPSMMAALTWVEDIL